MSILIEQLKQWVTITKGNNLEKFFSTKLKDAKDVKVECMKDVLTPEQIRIVKRLRIKKKECYKNAYMVAEALGCEYVEGQMLLFVGIDHAFNKIGDKYFDVTKEIALKENPCDTEYIALGEWSSEEALRLFIEKGRFGELYNLMF